MAKVYVRVRVTRFKQVRVGTNGRTERNEFVAFLANAFGKHVYKTQRTRCIAKPGCSPLSVCFPMTAPVGRLGTGGSCHTCTYTSYY